MVTERYHTFHMKHWRVLSWPNRPAWTRSIKYCCADGCMNDSIMPIGPGIVEAQLGMGLVSDPANPVTNLPATIECPHCRRSFELAPRPTHRRKIAT